MVKECLECKKEFEAKMETAKYCSVNCRVKWNQKNKNKKAKIREDVLVNMISEMNKKFLAQIENSNFPPMVYPQSPKGIIPAVENDNDYVPVEDKFSTFQTRLRKCKDAEQLTSVLREINASDLGFFPKKNLKQLADEIGKDFFTD